MNPSRSATLARAANLRARFEDAGAQVVETPVLQPAGILLDLYGEDIRARAYVTSDALRGEQMLRPDFTVPVVQMHMDHAADPARYTYAGEVFRRQEQDPDRASEYIQVGYELFDRSGSAAADAEVFALIADTLTGLPLRAATGDIGILMAAVQGLDTSDARKSALMRHLWHPRRFHALLERFSGRATPPPSRQALLAQDDPLDGHAPIIGKRRLSDVEARIDALRADAATPPICARELTALETLLKVRETLPYALERLRDVAVDLPQILPALDRLAARIKALTAQGIDTDTLDFEASYGRTSMEYYDGFVFGFYAQTRPDLPPIATGGRYDALTRRLGKGAEIPAVGGVLRPDLMLLLEGAQT
ncbi:MAG: ATP phosphoribosyltransferase regulatory subunit [Rhodobacteraceae bacterium]|nr:ATP phosphoribosyltransferase regulatory subunit [Paracoccaceae bacterium]